MIVSFNNFRRWSFLLYNFRRWSFHLYNFRRWSFLSFFLGLHVYTHDRLLEYPFAYMQHNLCKNSPPKKYQIQSWMYYFFCQMWTATTISAFPLYFALSFKKCDWLDNILITNIVFMRTELILLLVQFWNISFSSLYMYFLFIHLLNPLCVICTGV